MQVTKENVMKVIEAILSSDLELNSQHEVDIKEDFYWNISESELYNIANDPSDFTIGQLSDDWQELVKILEKKNEPVLYDLTKVASILRYLATR